MVVATATATAMASDNDAPTFTTGRRQRSAY
jgi:hypothetical protein